MAGEIKELSKYSLVDVEKKSLIDDALKEISVVKSELCQKFEIVDSNFGEDIDEQKVYELNAPDFQIAEPTKYCPECGAEFPEFESVCMRCLVHLKKISDKIDVRDIEFNPQFAFKGDVSYNSFDDLLGSDNILKIDQFNFSIKDFKDILYNIKSQAFKNFDNLLKTNEINFDSLKILEKIILFTKSFVKLDYKSSGVELGYFEDGAIHIDDRQTDSLQITTMIHELSHFLIHEILTQIICKILDASKNEFIETVVTFILSYTPFTELIDEYCAHNVEGRFTLFGYQDYSSYLQIESSLKDEMSVEEIEITKSIGNTFALFIKDILESLIDRDLREEIKEQFLDDVLDKPNYMALKMENCQILNDEGFVKSLWLILSDGCKVASANIEGLNSLNT